MNKLQDAIIDAVSAGYRVTFYEYHKPTGGISVIVQRHNEYAALSGFRRADAQDSELGDVAAGCVNKLAKLVTGVLLDNLFANGFGEDTMPESSPITPKGEA